MSTRKLTSSPRMGIAQSRNALGHQRDSVDPCRAEFLFSFKRFNGLSISTYISLCSFLTPVSLLYRKKKKKNNGRISTLFLLGGIEGGRRGSGSAWSGWLTPPFHERGEPADDLATLTDNEKRTIYTCIFA